MLRYQSFIIKCCIFMSLENINEWQCLLCKVFRLTFRVSNTSLNRQVMRKDKNYILRIALDFKERDTRQKNQ